MLAQFFDRPTKIIFSVCASLAFAINLLGVNQINQRPIVVVVPSYNNQQWTEQNLNTILTQQYDNFRVIFIDDCSSDNNYLIAKNCIDNHRAWHRTTLVHNQTRQGAMANLYNAIHSCPDDAIIATVDGDDWLPHAHVLSYLNNEYSTSNIWLTFGQFVSYPRTLKGFNAPFEKHIIQNNQFRQSRGHLPMSHLRTFEAWLFKRVKLKDFMYEGKFLSMTWDKAMMAAMVEMAGERHKCIENEILYVYNEANPINDHKVDVSLQRRLCDIILSKPPYARLDDRCSIAAACDEKKAEIILFSHNYEQAKSSLINICHAFEGIARINILFNSQNTDSINQFNGLKEVCPSITLFNYNNSTFKHVLVDCFSSISNDYVVLMQSDLELMNCNMYKVIYDLERTGALSYILARIAEPFEKSVLLNDSLRAYQLKYASAGWNRAFQAQANCYRKSDLRHAIYNQQYSSLQEFLNQANRSIRQDDDVVLIHD